MTPLPAPNATVQRWVGQWRWTVALVAAAALLAIGAAPAAAVSIPLPHLNPPRVEVRPPANAPVASVKDALERAEPTVRSRIRTAAEEMTSATALMVLRRTRPKNLCRRWQLASFQTMTHFFGRA
jgi:hypothetical protein